MPITRRRLLIAAGVVGGGLMVGAVGAGVYVGTYDQVGEQRNALKGARLVAKWLTIDDEGNVRIICPHTEMGQGTLTGILQIVLDELSADPDKTTIETAPALPAFTIGDALAGLIEEVMEPPRWSSSFIQKALGRTASLMNMQFTGGSMSTRFTGMGSMRTAAAAAREMLTAAAAQELGVPVSELTTAKGQVIHEASGRTIPYGQVASAAASMPIPADPTLKDRSAWTYIGTPYPRIDIPDKVFGRAEYGIDVEVPDMRFAAVAPPPHAMGKVIGLSNRAEVEAMTGVEAVVVLPDCVAVVADNPWRAQRAASAAKVTSAAPEGGPIDTAADLALQRSTIRGATDSVYTAGDGAADLGGDVVEAEYTAPFLAHTPMEPLNATVWVEGDKVHVATGVQGPLACRLAAAEVLGRPFDDVILHAHTMGGGFGRRNGLSPDSLNWVAAACRIHNAVGGAVKMTWSREAEIPMSPCRPSDAAYMRAKVGADGKPTHWYASTYAPVANPTEAVPPYDIPHISIHTAAAEPALPYAFWRSVDASSYLFFIESFIDELARKADQDPVDYRLSMLEGRHARVLEKVASMCNWDKRPRQGNRGYGVAIAEAFGSIVAEVVDVSMEDGTPTVHQVWCAIDCGTAVNTGSVEAQCQGGIHFGLSAALYGRIDTKDGSVVQRNFHNYRMVTFRDAPRITVEILESPEAPVGGVGEASTPCVAPALANAIATISERPRDLPFVS